MKSLLWIITALWLTLTIIWVYALEIPWDSIHLEAKNAKECEGLWWTYIAWEDEIYCITSPEKLLSSKQMEEINIWAKKISILINKRALIYEQVRAITYTYEKKFLKEWDVEMIAIVRHLRKVLIQELPKIENFKECKFLGGQVRENNPLRCTIFEQRFTQEIEK